MNSFFFLSYFLIFILVLKYMWKFLFDEDALICCKKRDRRSGKHSFFCYCHFNKYLYYLDSYFDFDAQFPHKVLGDSHDFFFLKQGDSHDLEKFTGLKVELGMKQRLFF